MKTASILLALVAVLGFVREAGAYSILKQGYTFEIGNDRFGIADYKEVTYGNRPRAFTRLYAGPLGALNVPFTATQGLAGLCAILAMLIIVPVVLTIRSKKKRAAQ